MSSEASGILAVSSGEGRLSTSQKCSVHLSIFLLLLCCQQLPLLVPHWALNLPHTRRVILKLIKVKYLSLLSLLCCLSCKQVDSLVLITAGKFFTFFLWASLYSSSRLSSIALAGVWTSSIGAFSWAPFSLRLHRMSLAESSLHSPFSYGIIHFLQHSHYAGH